MLPFLQPKKMASTILSKRGGKTAEVAPEIDSPNDGMDEGLKSAAQDLISAIHSKSVSDVGKALRAAWSILEATEVDDEEEGNDGDMV